MAWTKEQLEAINQDNSNIIVSAGAGSGKTAVLTERVIRKLKDGVNVDKLLVLTFTNEAANEMKSRIRDAIIKNNMDDQLSLLDSAYITTFDSFALSMVKKYHYLLNISNKINIIDSNIILINKYKIIDEIFEKMYGNEEFNQLINDFCLKDDKNIKQQILNLSDKLELLIDKEDYINNYEESYYSKSNIENYIKNYLELIQQKVYQLEEINDRFQSYITSNLSIKLDTWLKPLFTAKSYDEYILFNTMEPVRFTGVDEGGKIIKEELKNKIDEIKKLLKYNNEQEIAQSIYSTQKYIHIILNVIKEIDKQIKEYKNKYEIYEFNDIAHMAIQVVQENEEIQAELKNHFNEIMVDEYQDTSSIQEKFIELISNNNVYMVGDIKQSIYRFRNANPYIFQEKYDNYSNQNGGIKIDLLKNFRSRKETLANINEIFNLIMDNNIGNANYLESHNMMYGNTLYDEEDTGHDNNLEIYNYQIDKDDPYTKEEKELFIIAEDIIEKIKNDYQVFDKKTGKLRKIRYSDICIITDRNKYFDQYKKILEYKGIPSVLFKDEILTNDDDILVLKNLINLVDYVNKNIYDSKFKYLFTSVSRSFLFEYDDNKIYNILTNKTYKNDEIIIKCKEINLYQPLTDIITSIIDSFNIYEKLTKLTDIEKSIIRISNLLDIANSVNTLEYDISDFINYLDAVIENGLTVKYSVNTSGEDAVKIMNIHKSKGLEFSLCYFTGMHNKFTIKEINEQILFSTKYGIILPYKKEELEDTIIKHLYVDNYFKEEVSEKIRLFYVAVTRCREKMIIVTSLDAEKEKSSKLLDDETRLKYRSFLDILNSISVLDKYIVNKEAKYSKKYDDTQIKNINLFENNEKIEKRNIEIEYISNKKEHFSKKIKEVISKEEINAMTHGTEIHEILEYSDFKEKTNKYIDNLLNHFDKNFINVYKEYEFVQEKENIEYHGVIDLMLEYDNYINIIDYKLKDINDSNYETQLKGYKEYIESITNKQVLTYLYSIIDNKIKKID